MEASAETFTQNPVEGEPEEMPQTVCPLSVQVFVSDGPFRSANPPVL